MGTMEDELGSHTRTFDERLSEVVSKFPLLFDKINPGFKDRNKKRDTWEKIARELDIEGGGRLIF